MKLSTETLHPTSSQDDLKFNYDRTNFKSQSFLREDTPVYPHPWRNNTIPSFKDVSPAVQNVEVQENKKNFGLPHCSANEMANVCYAKIWRSASCCLDEEDEIHDDGRMSIGQFFPSYCDKDLDKLRKLRLKSKLKAKKYKERAEVKKWIETPDEFLSVLKDIRNNGHGTEINMDNNNNNTQMPLNTDTAELFTHDSETNKTVSVTPKRNQVHFPEHVLLCGALQEGDPKEVTSIINNYKIDLNSLSRLTGYHYLHKTITNGQFNCAKILIQNGIDVNVKDSGDISPLALAFRLMDFQMVALLIDFGANLFEYTKIRISELERVKELSRSVSKVFEMEL